MFYSVNILNVDRNCTDISFGVPVDKKTVGPPARRQAITSINDNQIYGRIYVLHVITQS